MPQASDFDAKLYQNSENAQQICNKFAPKTSNIRKSKNKKEISLTHSISIILLHFCFFLLDLLSIVLAFTSLDSMYCSSLTLSYAYRWRILPPLPKANRPWRPICRTLSSQPAISWQQVLWHLNVSTLYLTWRHG